MEIDKPASAAPKIPKLKDRIVLKDQTEELLKEAAKKEKKELRWMWMRLMSMKKADESYETTVFADLTAFLDGKAKLPPYVTDKPLPASEKAEKRKATDPTGETPDGKKVAIEERSSEWSP